MKFELPKLTYPYNALEPYIDAKTMEIHHSKHHQAYTDKLNMALNNHPELFEKSIEDLLKNLSSVPEGIRTAVKNHGGGYYNHNLFWEIIGPSSSKEPQGELKEAIIKKFTSFEKFKEDFFAAALNLFGSGWAWLSVNNSKELILSSTSNQDCPISEGLTPVFCLDVWEHAYYLKYQNKRIEYIKEWWNIVNWNEVNKNFGLTK